MHRLFSGSIQKTLIILVCIGVLPALLIILHTGIEQRKHAIAEAQKEMLLLAESMAQIQKGYFRSTHQMLAALARTSEIRSFNGDAASAVFKYLVEKDSAYINIVAMDAKGDVFAAARSRETVNLSDRHHIQRAMREKQFVVGEYIITRVGQTRPSLPFAYPVLDENGNVTAVLASAMHLEGLSDLFDVNRMPENSFIAVSDATGVRIFYYPPKAGTNPIGQPIVQSAYDVVRNARSPGISLHTGSDGVRRVFAYHPVCSGEEGPPCMTMWAGIPESAVIFPANLALAANLALMLLVGILAVVLSWLIGGRLLISPIRQLVKTAKAFAAGNLDARTGLSDTPGELGVLAGAFDHMAEGLVKSQDQLRSIADYTFDWEYWIGPQGDLLWMSPSCERITGYRPDDFLVDPGLISRIVADQDRSLFNAHATEEIDPNYSNHLDFRIHHKSGDTVWINHHCLPIHRSDGVFLGRRVSNRDITDRKRVEKALATSEAQFRSLVEGAPEAIFVQTDFCFAYVNEAAVRLFGAQTPEALLGTPVLDRFHPDYREMVKARIRQLNIVKSKVPRLEQIYLRLDGSPVTVETTAVPITYGDKNGALVFVQDITERKQMLMQLQQAQKMEAIGVLAGGIAHDFNNILFPIMGLSEILLDDLPPDTMERENVTEIYQAARRAGDLVNQILSFSRQSEHKKIPLRIQQVLKEVAKLARSSIPADIVFNAEIQADCGPVLADATNIHQIAMNLVTNAFHSVEANGGSITMGLKQVAVGMAESPESGLEPGDYALLTVSDTGTGIPEEVLPDIFNPYFTTKPQGKGTGLGLSVVFGIVKDHGGEIKVDSKVGTGTTIRVYLPLMEREATVEIPDATAVHAMGTERVLAVDDEEQIVRMEKQMLERLGYRVATRTSSIDALEAFKADPWAYDVVITDMSMPNMTGDELARQLIAERPDIPVVLCTGFSERITTAKAAALGIKGLLMKPVARGELAAVLRQVLDDK